jgi:hypothetical protein
MPNATKLFRLLSEFTVLLLGALVIVLAISRPVGVTSPLALVVLGAVLIYWGGRIFLRTGREANRMQERIRGGSLLLVGILVLGIRWLPLRDESLLLELSGAVLVIRGLAGGILLAWQK